LYKANLKRFGISLRNRQTYSMCYDDEEYSPGPRSVCAVLPTPMVIGELNIEVVKPAETGLEPGQKNSTSK
jgi:hypothetical protein